MTSFLTSLIRHVIVITIFSGMCANQACASVPMTYNTPAVTIRSFQNYGVQGIKVTSFIWSTTAASRVKCCDICAKTDGCVLANYNKSGKQCRLSDVDTWENLAASSTLQEGWTLFNGADTDDCTSNPCINGGTCVDQVNAYTCSCILGYVGDSCETDTNDCTGNPCMNGGTCVDQVNAYMCMCVDRYGGTNCETLTSCAYSDMVLANNQCYYFSSGSYSRADGEIWLTDNRNTHLVDITSEAEFESVKLAYENKYGTGVSHNVWIGGNDISVEGTLVWYDGTPVVGGYTRWGSAGLNNNEVNDCIAMDLSANWTWTIANCGSSYRYVAEENNDN